MPLLGLSLALVIGISLGLLGGGGSVLTVPIFHYILGYGVKSSIAMSLGVVGVTSAAGALGRLRSGDLNGRAVLTFAPVAMLGTFGGARLALLVPSVAQLVLFAATMLVAALFMWRGRPADAAAPARPHVLLVALIGGAVGILTGLVGVGGGFLIVPALVLLLGVPVKEAVGTSLGVIALNSASGFAGYWGKVEIDLGFMAAFTAIAIVGVFLGTRLGRQVSPGNLRKGFAVLLIVVGSAILLSSLLGQA
ncbi:MAG: sulfite exporter TauE/SafE family protein [Gemmatimonadales bacterium]|jgi:uncharacterized membrane protein YfcA|nr:MAG: sulfite exporter TauE/SafE family protein [Gemmatimonadales bacterium]